MSAVLICCAGCGCFIKDTDPYGLNANGKRICLDCLNPELDDERSTDCDWDESNGDGIVMAAALGAMAWVLIAFILGWL